MSPGVGENSRAVTFYLFAQFSGFSRALILRKSLSPPIPVGALGGGWGWGRGGGVPWIQMTGALLTVLAKDISTT